MDLDISWGPEAVGHLHPQSKRPLGQVANHHLIMESRQLHVIGLCREKLGCHEGHLELSDELGLQN
jgi:hypothetical protein